MARFIAGMTLAAFVFAILYFATIRPNRHPLLIDAKALWCDYKSGPPPIDRPRQFGKRAPDHA